jgi:hypothetical protein
LGSGFALHSVASAISGASDPSFAHPDALRLGLAFGVWGALLLTSCLGNGAIACWLWLSGLGVVTAALLPGISPFFVFPSMLAAAVLPFAADRRWLLALPAAAGLIVWLGLNVQGEELLGLVVHPLFTLTAGFALIALAPLLPRLKKREWIYSISFSFALALVGAVAAGFLPPYTAAQPQRLNLRYVEQGGRAVWSADPVRHFPGKLRAAGRFSTTPQSLPGLGNNYIAAAGSARFPAPAATVARDGNKVVITLQGSAQADGMILIIPNQAGLISAAIGGRIFAPNSKDEFRIICATAECRNARIVLGFKSTGPVSLLLTEQRFGLPPDGAKLIAARGPDAVASQFGNQTLLVSRIEIPAR